MVSVIIVTAAVKNYLKECLDSLQRQTHPSLEFIVIDNSLNPAFSGEISKKYPEIKLYSSPKNLFYCAALNKGINIAKGGFILCLNDDIVLDKGFIDEALKGFGVNGSIGMVSGKILRSDGKTIDSAGLFLSFWRTAKERGYGIKDKRQYENEEYIFGVNGAAAFYRREMLADIRQSGNYFDEDFRVFYEDLDIAWRGQNLGWKAYYAPSAIAYHARGGTVRQGLGINRPCARRYLNDELHFDLIKNRHIALIKNESCRGLISHLPFILVYDLLALGYVLIFRPLIAAKIILNREFIKSAFKKRKLIKKIICRREIRDYRPCPKTKNT